MVDWTRTKPRILPRRVSPIQDETTASYVSRLAAVNHLDPWILISYLDRGPVAGRWTQQRFNVPLAALAAASGLLPAQLAYALPDIRSQLAELETLNLVGRTQTGEPNYRRPACRRCMAAKNISRAVPIWMRPDHNACLRHQLWIGQGVREPEDQVEIADLPEISQAQIRHRNLIRRHGHKRVGFFYRDAQEAID
jgi:hypothetical protein